MQNIVWKLILIVVILGLCLGSIFTQDLRLGKDLRGGVSLIYKISLPEDGRDPTEVQLQTITVLKDRVNPTGVLDISFLPLGRDRIEVVMPLPNAEVQALAKAYRDALDRLLESAEIRPTQLDDALRRRAAATELGGGTDSPRSRAMAELQTAFDAQGEARENLERERAAGASAEEIRALSARVAIAELSFEDQYDAALALSLPESRIRRTVGLSAAPQRALEDDGVTVRVDEAGNPVMLPSPRDQAVDQLRTGFPDVSAQIDAAIAAYDAYQDRRTGFDDPEDLIRLLRGAGVLEFHIGVTTGGASVLNVDDLRSQLQEKGPENVVSPVAKWFPINELKQWANSPDELKRLAADPIGYFASTRGLVAAEYEGEYYLLLYTLDTKCLTHDDDRAWSIVNTFPTQDQLGRPAVSFTLDATGGGRMSRLTGSHLREPMAIVLDGQVYSAPTIQGQISTNGQISGSFSQEEVSYLIRVLAAGSLQARLSDRPIAVNTLGPSIGADNLNRGREAFIIALIAVAAFMLVYYLFAGVVANIALIANGIIIFGVMMGIDGTFTLPGLAGIVLTIGMAVDANVLIYERIREEIFAGELDLRGAVRQGYAKALSTILDANITNLIVCLVLFKTATTEVKGFALTLTIGIMATLFTALFVTRQIFFIYTDVFRAKKLAMLPTLVPAVHRALEPNIDWIGMRKIFWAISIVVVLVSGFLVWDRGVDMFDTEFRGGVSLTMETAVDPSAAAATPTGEPARLLLQHTGAPGSVEERIHAIGIAARTATPANDDEQGRFAILRELENAAVLTSGLTVVRDGTVHGSAFQVKVASPKGLDDDRIITDVIVNAIVDEFGTDLDVTQPLTYDGASDTDSTGHVFAITKDDLGKNINRPDVTLRVPEFLGGAAVLLENVSPPVSPEEVAERIDNMRNQPDFVKYAGRRVSVVGLKRADVAGGASGFKDLVVLVYDEFRSALKVDAEVFYDEVADPEWKLIGTALQRPTSLQQVSSYSSAVAATLSAQAIVAVVLSLLGILVYIWVRFGSLRYSVAAIVALVHDVTISLGLLALSGIVGPTLLGNALLVEPFRIDLGVVAALLTIIGYSLNDTIVILDRIRENRGKLPLPTAPIVNRSINQTVSRTLLTSVTTLVAVLIMYAEGGSGIRPFTFCLLVGLVVGTYSSVAIAAPLVFTGSGKAPTAKPYSRGKSEVSPAGLEPEVVG